jgi:glycosyltransferase involved in cell wall biosynthesis
MPTNGKPSICFVALRAYGLLSGREDIQHIGGAEVQQVLIGRELAKRGYRVSFVVLDHGQPDGVEHEGIRVWRAYAPDAGKPGFRFVHPRWTLLRAALNRAGADVVLQRAAGCETGQVALWCQWHGRPLAFSAGSNSDCERRLPYLKTRPERTLYRYGLRRAACVVAQTETQVRMLREGFGIDAILIRSCSADPSILAVERLASPPEPRGLLWVGRFASEKRPEMVLDLAEACPEFHYDIVGGPNGANAFPSGLQDRARELANVRLHGRIPHENLGAFYDRAVALVCTSKWEGFPNTFMEAWARGVPVVSTVDPDGVVGANHLGWLGNTVPELAAAIRAVPISGDDRRECSRRVRRFFLENHTVAATVDAYERLFRNLLG